MSDLPLPEKEFQEVVFGLLSRIDADNQQLAALLCEALGVIVALQDEVIELRAAQSGKSPTELKERANKRRAAARDRNLGEFLQARASEVQRQIQARRSADEGE